MHNFQIISPIEHSARSVKKLGLTTSRETGTDYQPLAGGIPEGSPRRKTHILASTPCETVLVPFAAKSTRIRLGTCGRS